MLGFFPGRVCLTLTTQPATKFFCAGWVRVRPNPPQPALFAGQNQPAPTPSSYAIGPLRPLSSPLPSWASLAGFWGRHWQKQFPLHVVRPTSPSGNPGSASRPRRRVPITTTKFCLLIACSLTFIIQWYLIHSPWQLRASRRRAWHDPDGSLALCAFHGFWLFAKHELLLATVNLIYGFAVEACNSRAVASHFLS